MTNPLLEMLKELYYKFFFGTICSGGFGYGLLYKPDISRQLL